MFELKILNSLDRYPEAELLDNFVCSLFSFLWGIPVFQMHETPIYIPTNNVGIPPHQTFTNVYF